MNVPRYTGLSEHSSTLKKILLPQLLILTGLLTYSNSQNYHDLATIPLRSLISHQQADHHSFG